MQDAGGGAGTRTIFVTPASTQPGNGSAESPFLLVSGREYQLNRLIRPLLDQGLPVKLVFRDGLYADVELQIIKQGIDTSQSYLSKFPAESGREQSNCRFTARCNEPRPTRRVMPADFTMGPDINTPLELAAEHDHQAIFDGSHVGAADRSAESQALLVSGAMIGGPTADPYRVRSRRISNIVVRGLVFRNYHDGLHITYAERIEISNCIIESMGNHSPRHDAAERFGTFGVRVDGASRLILIVHNRISHIWNATGSATAGAADDAGLIHSIYQGYAKDVLFLGNDVRGSSGPIVKFGFYPRVRGQVVYQYPASAGERRSFFIGNHFALTLITNGHEEIPPYQPTQAFIHDNSREATSSGESAPASAMIFIDNLFENCLSPDPSVPVALIRQELPVKGDSPLFPAWYFCGNTLRGIQPGHIVATRRRGTEVSARSLQFSPDGPPQQFQPAPRQHLAEPRSIGCQDAEALLAGPLRSGDSTEDANMLQLLHSGKLPSGDAQRPKPPAAC